MNLLFLILGVNAVGLAGLLVARARRKPDRAVDVDADLDAYNPEVREWLVDLRNRYGVPIP